MKLIEKNLDLYDSVKIFDIIEEVLKENRNTQVFVESYLFSELLINGENVNVIETYCYNATYHYVDNRIKWLKYERENTRSVASFVYNSFNYLQVVEYFCKSFERYVHSCEKIEQILIISKK